MKPNNQPFTIEARPVNMSPDERVRRLAAAYDVILTWPESPENAQHVLSLAAYGWLKEAVSATREMVAEEQAEPDARS